MKIAFIAPTSLIEDFHGDFHLALSHLIGSSYYKNEYVRSILATHLPIILDNGLFENGKAETLNSLIKKARLVGAQTMLLPDSLYNRKKTEATIMKMKDWDESIQLGAVVQADNAKDFIESYQWMVEQPHISLIGLSILSVPKAFKELTGTDDITTNRIECLRVLNSFPKHKRSHLLGAGSSYKDIEYAINYCPWVVSHDSSSAIWNAVQGKQIDPFTLEVEGGKTEVKVDFKWNEELSAKQLRLIDSNMRVVKRLAKTKTAFTKAELKDIY